MIRKRLNAWIGALGVVLVASACAGGSSARRADEAPPSTTSTPSTGSMLVTVSNGAVEEARAAFDAYRAALIAGDGSTAVELMTPSSLDHVAELQQLAMVAGPQEIAGRPLADRLMIAALRVLAPPAVLRAGSAAELLAGAVDAGLVGASVTTATVHGVTVDAETAAVTLSTASAPTGLRLIRHGGVWRVDLVDALASASTALVTLARQLDVAEDDLILALLATTVGRPVGPEVFAAPP